MADKKKKPPLVSAQSRGQVNDILEIPATAFRRMKENVGKALRWVYQPEGGKDFGKALLRRAQGYEPVSVEETGIDGFGQSGDHVRVADVVLHKIDEDIKEDREAFLEKLALEEANASQEAAFAASLEEGRVGGKGVTPVGRVDVEKREHEILPPPEKA